MITDSPTYFNLGLNNWRVNPIVVWCNQRFGHSHCH